MSRWHLPQVWLVRKEVAGMMPPTLVRAEEGKNGFPALPAPSPSIVSGGSSGVTMRERCLALRASPAADVGPGRGGEERVPGLARAFALHRERRVERVHDAEALLRLARVPGRQR